MPKKAATKKVATKKAVASTTKKTKAAETSKPISAKVKSSKAVSPETSVLVTKAPKTKATGKLTKATALSQTPEVVGAEELVTPPEAAAVQLGEKVKTEKPKARKSSKTGLSKAEEAANQLSSKWMTFYRKTQDQKPKPYNMRATFEAKTPIMHKLLGWGYVLANKNDRLEVLFKDGIKYLISNYKA